MRHVVARLAGALVLAVVICGVGVAVAPADAWQFAPVNAPAPPDGTAPGPFPVPLGQVGQISFWAPNRGLLITGGTEATGGVVPAGLYDYDGVAWHLLSTVCGGAHGRIAWAGPDDFWTISDQRPGQLVSGTAQPDLEDLSLCHFVDGAVVASYAQPLGQVDSYQQIDAAACLRPDDCWFGGQDANGLTPGAFQLHWDGTSLTALHEPEDHSVDDMTDFQGQIYESVRIAPGDEYLPTEDPAQPALLHRLGADEDGPFFDDAMFGDGQVLPDYGAGVQPDALEGFALSADGGPDGDGSTQLWAAANPESDVPTTSLPASLTVLHHVQSGWMQVTPAVGSSPTSCQQLPSGTVLSDSVPALQRPATQLNGTADGSIAALPGTDEAWLSLGQVQPAVALLDGDGCVQELDSPSTDGVFTQAPGQSSPPGPAGPVACPAADDCWMATQSGWLYHYTDGSPLGQDTDPAFAGVITGRPTDSASVTVPSDIPPPDDSGVDQPPPPPPTGTVAKTRIKRKTIAVRLTKVKAKVEHKTRLVLSFDLNVRARIQILAERHTTVVARSQRRVLKPGRRTVTLTIDPKRYPTHIKVNAKAEPKS